MARSALRRAKQALHHRGDREQLDGNHAALRCFVVSWHIRRERLVWRPAAQHPARSLFAAIVPSYHGGNNELIWY